jgi:hypothetical protein
MEGGDSFLRGSGESGDNNNPGHVDVASTVHALPAKLEGDLTLLQECRKKPTLEEVLGKISMFPPLTPPRDASYFHRICGLSKDGRNPHSLTESRDGSGGAL